MPTDPKELYQLYLQDHGKPEDFDEDKFKLWLEVDKLIKETNEAAGEDTDAVRLAHNMFSDLSDAEYSKIMGYLTIPSEEFKTME